MFDKNAKPVTVAIFRAKRGENAILTIITKCVVVSCS